MKTINKHNIYMKITFFEYCKEGSIGLGYLVGGAGAGTGVGDPHNVITIHATTPLTPSRGSANFP